MIYKYSRKIIVFAFSIICLEVVVISTLNNVGITGFSVIPYIRMITVFFTFIYFFFDFINFRHQIIKFTLSLENILVLLWVSLLFNGVLIGVFLENNILYIITDFIYILFGFFLYTISSYYLTVINKSKTITNDGKLINISSVVILFLAVFSFLLNSHLNGGFIIFACAWMLIVLINKKYTLSFLLMIVLILGVSSRASLVTLLCVVLVYIYREINQLSVISKMIGKLGVFLLTPVLLFILFMTLYNYLPHDHPIYYRLNQFVILLSGSVDYSSKQLISIMQRVVEAKEVLSQVTQNTVTIIFGSGLGATIPGTAMIDSSVTNASFTGGGSIHNIHILPFALLHKHGVFGIIIFTLLVLNFFKSIAFLVRLKQPLPPLLLVFSNAYFISIFLFALPASNFLWTSALFWISLGFKDYKVWKD